MSNFREFAFKYFHMDEFCPIPEPCQLEHVRQPLSPPSSFKVIFGSELDELFQIKNLFLADLKFKALPIEEFDRFYSYNLVDKEKYVSEFHDCDDFSEECKVDCRRFCPGAAIWEIWVFGGSHSQNLVCDDTYKLWKYEGQTDERIEVDINDISFLR